MNRSPENQRSWILEVDTQLFLTDSQRRAACFLQAAAAGTAAAGEGSSFGAGRIAGLCALGVTGYALYKASEEGSEMRTWAEARQAGEDGR